MNTKKLQQNMGAAKYAGDYNSGDRNSGWFNSGDYAATNGEITTFGSGAIRDSQAGKEDYTETISWTAFKRYAQYMTAKKEKYGAGNFKKGIPIDSYEKGIARHYQKYMENKYEEGDVEADQDHLAAIVFNTFGIMHEEEMAEKRARRGNKH
jgi:hypothetical protein